MADNTTVDWIIERSRRFPLLTPAEEIQLGRQVQNWVALQQKANPTREEQAIMRRGKRASDRLFACNIRLVVTIANRYRHVGGNLLPEDLIQEGMIGLQRAIVKFDPSRGYKFSTYAFAWIRQAISRGINSKGKHIRLPEHAYRIINKASEFMFDHEQEHQVLPPLQLVAAHTQVPMATLKRYMQHVAPVHSLDASMRGCDSGTFLDLVADAPMGLSYADEIGTQAADISKAMECLRPEQQDVLRRRYFLARPDTYEAIAKDMGVSRERVRQISAQALRLLRLKLSHAPVPVGTPALQCA
jgi:RNA polymerase primary sigma factor